MGLEAQDYKKIVETLRFCSKSECSKCTFEWDSNKAFCFDSVCVDASDAIEELQAEVEQLKAELIDCVCNGDLD